MTSFSKLGNFTGGLIACASPCKRESYKILLISYLGSALLNLRCQFLLLAGFGSSLLHVIKKAERGCDVKELSYGFSVDSEFIGTC